MTTMTNVKFLIVNGNVKKSGTPLLQNMYIIALVKVLIKMVNIHVSCKKATMNQILE